MNTEDVETAGTAADRGLRAALLVVVAAGLRRRDPGTVVNGAVGFVATFLPDVLAERCDLSFGPEHRVWLSGSMLLHAVGMLGPYDDVWWWDHVTHTLSASLVASLAHLVARARDRDPALPVLGATVGFGLVWEGIEYVVHTVAERHGLDPLLIQYGRRDTLDDLGFDVVGGLLVVAFGQRLLDGVLDASGDGSADDGDA